ncbi:MAG: deoxyribodipyrimidine photo-lyase [Nitrospinaceae bacterium]|nr:MAG: deoxyribodipyrimidine photo-lyase [Nitrospinaceae bacterium]
MIFEPEAIYIEEGAGEFSLTQSIVSRFPQTPVHRIAAGHSVTEEIKKTSSDVFGAGKKQLVLSRFKGSFLKKCPGISPGMVCCNYYVVNLMKNCIYDCSYCFLQGFLENNPLMVAYVNVEDLIAELDAVFRDHPDRMFRVGTGELTDSLALEDVVPYADQLIPFFNKKENAVLELKTKSDNVGELLKQESPKNVIVSWSLNPPNIIEQEEKGTPQLHKRLEAARLCREKGYRVGFHFDPIILHPGWERNYKDLIEELFCTIPPSGIEWISLGSFRYRSRLKQVIKDRHQDTRLFTGEHVPSKDGKYRYLRSLRNTAYETVRGYIQKHSRDLNIYLCMETKEVWEGVTGKMPRSDKKLDQFFDL